MHTLSLSLSLSMLALSASHTPTTSAHSASVPCLHAHRHHRTTTPRLQAPEPFAQAEVPTEQQPTVEMRQLKQEPFMPWAELDDTSFYPRIAAVWSLAFFPLSLPIALSTYTELSDLPTALLAANVGGSSVLLAFLLRLRAGWGYVSMRLTDRVTYYEDNGASGRGGYIAEKDDSTSMRDRLLDQYEVQPALRRVDGALRVAAASLFISALLLRTFAPADPYEESSPSYLSRLQADDKLAEQERQKAESRAAAKGVSLKPSYCDSRYYKAIAGGESSGVCDR